MAHGEVRHDYHLVNPSPWPLVASCSALVMALGLVTWMKGIFPVEDGTFLSAVLGPGTPYVFYLGAAMMIYTFVGWWGAVIKESHAGDHTPVVSIGLRYGMILFIASEVMFFAAWFWAYFNSALFPNVEHELARTELFGGQWPPEGIETFDPWHLPLYNTLILLTSGTTVTWAHHALLNGNRSGMIWGLVLTVGLGVIFTALQAYEYSHAAFGFSGHIYGATFFMATGFHGFHVIVGTIFLAVCLIRALVGHFSSAQHLGFEFAAWYWHFVDVVWLFLFAAIYVWGGGAHAGGAH